jgi:transglycosylase-like protein with SLT domain
MRPLLTLAILILGLNNAAPEPEYSSFFAEYYRGTDGVPASSLVEIETAAGRADRLAGPGLQPRTLPVEILRQGRTRTPLVFASASSDIGPEAATTALFEVDQTTDSATDSARSVDNSLDNLCTMLLTSAQDNDLPIPFFANLLWQESRLKDDVVSKKGALGIAQFMPQTAAETGLVDPFDPTQAIPASARLLRMLRLEFGNLGFVAAAYNAGAHRVADWLQHRSSLPRETRDYVERVTGLSADAWRKIPVDDAALTFVQRLPCRSLPAFASLEEQTSEQTQAAQEKLQQEEAAVAATAKETTVHTVEHKHGRHHREAHGGGHERHAAKREAQHQPHAARAKHRSA